MPPPALVVGVVSPGQTNRDPARISFAARDYRYKRSEYAARGIAEYWIVDPKQAQVTILTLVSGLYEEAVFQGDEYLISRLFPQLELTATQVLQPEEADRF